MPRFAANLSMMYSEHAFLDRFAAAARDGFDAVEFLFPYEHPPAVLRERLQSHGLTQVLFNLPPGDWAGGERGLAALPGREAQFRASADRALEYALALGCRHLHAMSGRVPDDVDAGRAREVLLANLAYAARQLQPHGLTLLIEPINTRDMPGYYLNYQAQAHDLVRAVGAPNLKVQMDLYHCQIMEGDLARRLERWLPGVGHLQVAGVPDRGEPDTGEVAYPFLFELIDRLGYDGHVGCEYRPRAGTSEGLGWWRAASRGRSPRPGV